MPGAAAKHQDSRMHDDGNLPWESLSRVLAGAINEWKSLPKGAPDPNVSSLRTVLQDMLHETHLGQ
jgi:hypothetical protein